MTFITNIVKIMTKYWQVFLIHGIGYTLLLSLIAVAGGAFFGSLMALAKRSRLKLLKLIVDVIVAVVRGTPVLLQLYIGVFVFPLIIPKLSSMPYIYSVSIVLIINSSAYVSEIIRSGIEAVDPGQMEAARSLGLPYWRSMHRVVLPQAIRTMIPSIINQFIITLKDTSILSVIGFPELVNTAKNVVSKTFMSFQTWAIVGIMYLIVILILQQAAKVIERRLKRGHRTI